MTIIVCLLLPPSEAPQVTVTFFPLELNISNNRLLHFSHITITIAATSGFPTVGSLSLP